MIQTNIHSGKYKNILHTMICLYQHFTFVKLWSASGESWPKWLVGIRFLLRGISDIPLTRHCTECTLLQWFSPLLRWLLIWLLIHSTLSIGKQKNRKKFWTSQLASSNMAFLNTNIRIRIFTISISWMFLPLTVERRAETFEAEKLVRRDFGRSRMQQLQEWASLVKNLEPILTGRLHIEPPLSCICIQAFWWA